MKKCTIIILLFVFFQSLTCIAQIKKATGKVVRIEGKSYFSQLGRLYEIDDKVVLAQLKKGRILPKEGIRNISHIAMDCYSVSVPDSIDIEKYVIMLEETGYFEFVEYNCIYTPCLSANDYLLNSQWYLSAINANAAWNITTGESSVKVAVIDSGVELNHPDLYYGNDNYSNLNVAESVDYVSSTDHTPSDSHGTRIAGIIGAKTNNNNVGVAGVAGGYGCPGVTIISYRTNYTVAQVISAIYDAISKNVKIINLSMEGSFNLNLSNALDYAFNNGVTVVCASGNGSSSSISFPASHEFTIAVGSINQSYQRASESNYGNGLDMVAPGTVIWTTCKSDDGYYNSDSGTSFATPQVAGVAALMLSVNPSLSPIQVKSNLQSTCTKLSGYSNDGWNSEVGYGLLNAYAAVYAVTPRLSGPSSFCTGATYSIVNLPAGATVNWSTNNCINIVSGQGTSTVSVVKNFNGVGSITADIVLNGNIFKTFSEFDIGVGTPSLNLMVYPQDANGNMGWDFTQAYNTFVVDDVVNQSYSYYQLYLYKKNGNNWTQVAYCPSAYSGVTYIPYFGTNGWYKMKIRGYGNCGYSDWWELEVLTFDSGMDNNLQLSLIYQQSTDILVVRMVPNGVAKENSPLNTDNEYIIQLWSENQLNKTVKTRSSEYTIPLSGLKKGVYFVRVIYEGKSYSSKFAKK